MALLSQLRKMDPAKVNDACQAFSARNDIFRTLLDGMHNDVKTALTSWKGDSAAAAAARALAEDLAGSHLADAVDDQIQARRTGAEALASSRTVALGIADEAIHAGCSVSDDGHVTAPDLKHTVDSKDLLVLQAAANEKAKVYEARLIPALAAFDELDAMAAAALDAATADVGALIQNPASTPERSLLSDIVSGKAQRPSDPKAFHDWWAKLSPGERDELYLYDRYLGNADGMPAADRDHYNRLTLSDEIGRATLAQSQADDLRAQHPDWAAGNNIPKPNEPGAIVKDRADYDAWLSKLNDAQSRAKYLPDLQAVDMATSKPDRKLMLLDTQTGRQARAAIAVGDPDTATHISVTTPGLNTTVTSIGDMTDEAQNLQREALRQLSLTDGHEHETVATIAWMGYDPPQIPGLHDLSTSIPGGYQVMRDDEAKAGAQSLSRFYDGLGVAHDGAPPHITAVGHSYGSLTTGLALQEPGHHPVSDMVVYGSPGIEASTPQQLGLNPGHAYVMRTPDDPIKWVYEGQDIAGVVLGPAALPLGHALGFGDFGPDPATNPNFVHLDTSAHTVPDGPHRTLDLEGSSGHSEYPRLGSNDLPRIPGYNVAAVVAGLGEQNAIRTR